MGRLIFASILLLALLLNPVPALAQATTTPIDPYNTIDVEKEVRSFFANTPVMIEIAKCESKFNQFNDQTGEVLDGGSGGMIGVFQINRPVHQTAAKALGFEIETLSGNLSYAKYLYDKEGTNPWISSFPCWNNKNLETTSVNLSFGMVHPQVVSLQQILNRSGFAIAEEGPGSPGNETNIFGNYTRDAVRRFQCAKEIACAGNEYSTGYGFVGPRTRAELMTATPPVVKAGSSLTETQIQAIISLLSSFGADQPTIDNVAAILGN